jgi:hypothetical protein
LNWNKESSSSEDNCFSSPPLLPEEDCCRLRLLKCLEQHIFGVFRVKPSSVHVAVFRQLEDFQWWMYDAKVRNGERIKVTEGKFRKWCRRFGEMTLYMVEIDTKV